MRKYFTIISTTIKEYSAYRLSFILWRVRIVLSVLVSFFLWNAVFDKQSSFANYQRDMMLTYILVVNFVDSVVLGTKTAEISSDINDGTIINRLLKPIDFIKFYIFRDLGDKILNFIFAVFEFIIIIKLFNITLVPTVNLPLALVFFTTGTMIAFCINLSLSLIGFWTTEVWAPRFVFLTLVFFLAGSYFPLDLLPKIIYQVLILTPFPYLVYFPTQILLGKEIVWQQPLIISCIWVIITYLIVQIMWKRGNRSFSFWGR